AFLGLASSAQAAPTVTMGLQVLTTTGATIAVGATVGGITNLGSNNYSMLPGTSFRLQATATVNNPNSTATSHQDGNTRDPLPSIPVGLQNLTFDLPSTGAAHGVDPTVTTSGTVGKWGLTTSVLATRQAIPAAVNFGFTNVIDLGGDGDLDPAGAGFNN